MSAEERKDVPKVKSTDVEENDVQKMSKMFQDMMKAMMNQAQNKSQSDWELASEPFKTEVEKKQDKFEQQITKPKDTDKTLTQEVFVTGTFLDKLYLRDDNQPLNGIPIVGQFGIVGLSGVGKSILVQEIALRIASSGKHVAFVTSEDIWESPNPRLDLQARMKQKAEKMGLNWETIKQNLFIFDTVANSELRDWSNFVSTYRYLIESQKGIDLLVVDSLTLMDSYRGSLKYHIQELSRYNQLHGVTGIYVSQRSEEEYDKFGLAGGMGVAHVLDSVICIDFGKASGLLKEDLSMALNKQIKQWDLVHFARILSCRLSGFDRKYIGLTITNDGFLRKL